MHPTQTLPSRHMGIGLSLGFGIRGTWVQILSYCVTLSSVTLSSLLNLYELQYVRCKLAMMIPTLRAQPCSKSEPLAGPRWVWRGVGEAAGAEGASRGGGSCQNDSKHLCVGWAPGSAH